MMRVVGRAYLPNTLKWSVSEHTQSSQTCKDEHFRMTQNVILNLQLLLLPNTMRRTRKGARRVFQDLTNNVGCSLNPTQKTAKELFEEGKVLNKNNLNFCFMFHPFFVAKNGWSPRNSRAAVPFTQKVTQTSARQLGLYKWISIVSQKCLLYLHSPQTNLACSCL